MDNCQNNLKTIASIAKGIAAEQASGLVTDNGRIAQRLEHLKTIISALQREILK